MLNEPVTRNPRNFIPFSQSSSENDEILHQYAKKKIKCIDAKFVHALGRRNEILKKKMDVSRPSLWHILIRTWHGWQLKAIVLAWGSLNLIASWGYLFVHTHPSLITNFVSDESSEAWGRIAYLQPRILIIIDTAVCSLEREPVSTLF